VLLGTHPRFAQQLLEFMRVEHEVFKQGKVPDVCDCSARQEFVLVWYLEE